MVNRRTNIALVHNGRRYILGFLFNIYTKTIYEDERF